MWVVEGKNPIRTRMWTDVYTTRQTQRVQKTNIKVSVVEVRLSQLARSKVI